MQGPATHSSAAGGPRPSLAQRAFPRRVRALLEGVLDYVSDELDRGLVTTLNEFEQQLFKLAEQAKNNELQKRCFEALREVKRGRADLTPRFLLGLEAALATLKDPPKNDPRVDSTGAFRELSLVEDMVLDEASTLDEIAGRAEVRNSLPLFLLGQRFGVVAGRPAFDAENLPVGPHALCRILRDAVGCLDLNGEYRQHLFRQFDRSVMQFIAPLYEALNTYLIKQRVLPHLTYVPVRVKPTTRDADAAPSKPATPVAESGATRATRAGSPGGGGGSSAAHGNSGLAGNMGARGGFTEIPGGGAAVRGGNMGGGAGDGGTGIRDAGGAGSGVTARGGGGGSGGGGSGGGGSGGGGSGGGGVATRDSGAVQSSVREGGAARFGAAEAAAVGHDTGPKPYTAWPGVPEQSSALAQQDSEMFDVLRQLLAGRRSLLGKLGTGKPAQNEAPAYIAKPDEVQSVLGMLQTRPATPILVDGKPQPRSVTHLKQDLLAQLRQMTPPGQAPKLAEEHGDTIDLVGMLFDHIMKDVRPNSPAAGLLTKLQVPLLRVALDDKGFFTRKQHPARQMLNTIAESGAYWTSEDEADRTVVDKMHMLVDRVGKEFTGDLTLFDALLGDLSSHMQTQARKAEVAERRHVEAARGKEKLELARQRAAESIDAKLAGNHVPKFLHSLLAQAWSDVLALSLLRGGEDSEGFRHQLHIAERLIESAVSRRTTGKSLIGPTEVQGLKNEIEEALAQVGYHANDAQAISGRLLTASGDEEDDDPASRTELTMRLKTRTRLGQSADVVGPAGEKLAPLVAAEKICLDQIRHLPFGSWFEFTTNQQGEVVRRRMSWYSTVTGNCLFVNHRGQRVGEYSLNWLAREMQRGNLRVVQAEQDSIIDRAWHAIVGALRSFSGKSAHPAT